MKASNKENFNRETFKKKREKEKDTENERKRVNSHATPIPLSMDWATFYRIYSSTWAWEVSVHSSVTFNRPSIGFMYIYYDISIQRQRMIFSIPCVRVRCEYYGCECIWASALCVCTTGMCMYLYTRMSEFLQLLANICTDYSIIVVAFVVFAATIFIHAYIKSQITLSYRNIILMHPIKDNFI